MSLARSLVELQDCLAKLAGAVSWLGTTVEDRPQHQDVVVASRLGDDVLAARGYIEEAHRASRDLQVSGSSSADILAVSKLLVACQTDFYTFCAVLATDLVMPTSGAWRMQNGVLAGIGKSFVDRTIARRGRGGYV